MSPQRNNFNTGVWLALEGQVQSWGRSCTASDTLYVVKGGTIDKEEQVKEYIGGDRSKPVPKYYYMALLFKKGDSFKAIAFWMEHTDSKPSKTIKLVDYALSIDELEEKTGIDFFPNLNDNLEMHLRLRIQQKRGRDWNKITTLIIIVFCQGRVYFRLLPPIFDITGLLTEVNPYLE